MFTVNGFDIKLTRGDTATLEVTFTGDVPTARDTVIAAIKPARTAKKALIEKTLERQQDETYLMRIESEETDCLPFGLYWWDLRILYEDGQITTPFVPARFEIVEVITDLPEDGEGG